jgi:hypothetical protein
MTRALEDQVRSRAANRCEYCQLPQAVHPWRLEIDHIIAAQHGGLTSEENLALCCPKCNRHKGPNLTGFDTDTHQVVLLFHPRQQRWSEHFSWNQAVLAGATASGRATVAVLNINDPTRIAVRQTLIEEGVFPPEPN